jgi:serralysin
MLVGGSGADDLNGGSGIDTADYTDSPAGVVVSLLADTAAFGDAEGDELNGIENLNGSAFDDWLYGDNNANFLLGGGGVDWLNGQGGDDALWGGDQPDTLLGMQGVDTLKGFGGEDILDGGTQADLMYGGADADVYVVDNAADSVIEVVGEGYDHVQASVSYGLAAGTEVEMLSTTLYTGTAAIDLTGNEFDNYIIGNAGPNVLTGGEGADTLDGGVGSDTLTGGAGADTIVWRSVADSTILNGDTITDFDPLSGDIMDLHLIDADGNAAMAIRHSPRSAPASASSARPARSSGTTTPA